MEIKDMNLEQLNARVAEIRQAMQAQDADIDALNKEMDAIEARRAELNTAETARRSLAARVASGAVGTVRESVGTETHTRTLEEVRSSAEYQRAFANYIRTGLDAECRSLTTNLVNTGDAVQIPTVITDAIAHAWNDQPLLREIRKVYVKGQVVVPVEAAADPAVVHTENGEAVSEENLTIVNVTINAASLKKWIGITDELLAMSDADLIAYVSDEITQRIIELACAQAVAAVTASTGTNGLNDGNVIELAADPNLADLAGLLALAEKAESGAFLMTRAEYFGKVLPLADHNSRPIWSAVMDGGKPTYMVFGYPVRFIELPSGYDRYYAFGDPKAILGNFPNGDGVDIIVDPYTAKKLDKVEVLGKMLAGFGVIRPDSFAIAATVAST